MATKPEHPLISRYYGLTRRERGLMTLCGAVVIVFLGYVTAIEPNMIAHERNLNRVVNTEQNLAQVRVDIEAIKVALRDNPNQALEVRLADLNREIADVQQKLLQETEGLVGAEDMPRLLETLLADSRQVALVSLRSMEAEPIIDNVAANDLQLYRHTVEMVVEGSFFNLLAYLEEIENLPWQFYWQSLDYRVVEYPTAEMKLTLYTYSSNQAFMGIADEL